MSAVLCGALALCAGAAVWCAFDPNLSPRGKAAAAFAAAVALGFVAPVLSAVAAAPPVLSVLAARRRRIERRRRAFAELPDFLELLALCLSSGQGLLSAWSTASSQAPPGEFAFDLHAASRALQAGRAPAPVMADLASRIGEPRCGMALALLAQAMVRGNPVEPVLLSQAAALRRLRALDLEKRAQTAPLRMMAPVFLFIFPAVLMLLLAPVFLSLAAGGALF